MANELFTKALLLNLSVDRDLADLLDLLFTEGVLLSVHDCSEVFNGLVQSFVEWESRLPVLRGLEAEEETPSLTHQKRSRLINVREAASWIVTGKRKLD